MSTLIVWALSDGKPGHVSQTQGLLAALDEEYDLAVHWLSCPLRFSGFKSLLRWCARFIPSSLQTLVMGLAYRMPEEPSQPPDLIVSAGGNTLFAAGHLARRHGACSVFSGSTKRYPEAWISLVVSVTPTQAINNLVLALPPASGLKQRPNIARPADTEPKEVQDFKPTLSSVSTLPPQSRPLTGALLIGGDGAGCRYLPSDWHRLAALLTDCYAHPLDWLTTTSRRTGDDRKRSGRHRGDQNSTFGTFFTAAASSASSSKKSSSENPNIPATTLEGKVLVASLKVLTVRL